METSRFLSSSLILLRFRLEVLFIWTWSTTIACLIVAEGYPPIMPTLKSLIAVLFITISVYLYNDVVDVEADKYNKLKRDRPLPSGRVPVDDAKLLCAISLVLGLAVGYTINVYSFGFILLYLFLFGAYSFPGIHLKKRVVIKEMIISSGPVVTSLIGSYAISQSLSYPALFAAGVTAFLGMVIQPGLNDTSDIEADKLQGVKTLAMALSWQRKMQLLISGILLVMILVPMVYGFFGFNILFPLWMVVGGLISLRYIVPIARVFEEKAMLKARKMVIVYWALMQVFSVLGTLNIPLPI